MQSAWNHCAPDALNFLQIGGMGLRIVFSGLGERGGLVGLRGGMAADLISRDWVRGLRLSGMNSRPAGQAPI
jgi:hypothetical protein